MHTLTYLIAQFIGLLSLIIGASMLLQKKVFVEVADNLVSNRALIYLAGIISLILGLLVVLAHNIWNAGFLPLVVTLIGWLMILRGIYAMVVPLGTTARQTRALKVKELSWLLGIILLVIGAYLTYAGFMRSGTT